ncbi:signal peptidase I [Nocardioides mangrovi]|uniref:Signal peptidase I n=1 Tax=Nocardioides mangrovi TaxID=2874580 RepID=A0ABS7UCW8_9ACTN|nr:signal peptidase I [Nocardioides mangrovi]MBZ5738492.1 signal peptidase I [Nocardioides mangrovi]
MPGKRRAETVLDGVKRALEWTLIAVVVGGALVTVVVPRVAGATPYAVRTGSMRPDMPPGTLVVVRPVDPDDLRIGAVVTFQPRQDDPTVVTHRIIGQGVDVDGRPVFRTQGDANDAPDPWSIRGGQVLGERWYSVPYLGYVTMLLSSQQRQVAVFVVAGGLLLYSAIMLLGALWDRMRRPPDLPTGIRHA